MEDLPRVFLIGFGPTTEAALRSLTTCTQVVGILRDTLDRSDPVIALAENLAIPVFTSILPNDLCALIEESQADHVVISSYNRIIKGDLLERYTVINVHFSPLPRYRGRAPVNWAIINGETFAAISIHLVDSGLDSGNILYQKKIPILPRDVVTDLYQRLNALQEQHLGQTVVRVASGYTGTPQDQTMATYGCARLPQDGEIDWKDSATHIDRLVRALAPPFPGAFTYFMGQRLIIRRAEPVDGLRTYAGRVPGRVIHVCREEGWIEILAGEGALRLFEVETHDGKTCKAADLISSTRFTLGLILSDLHNLHLNLVDKITKLEDRSYR
jgi:methionyl-tRNA formyltransferase